MGTIASRLAELGLQLPEPPQPVGNYVGVTVHDNVAYVAGHGPVGSGGPVIGLLGADLDVEEGYRAAKVTALAVLASLQDTLGDLDRVESWLRVVGYIHCAPGFNRNAEVLDGFSDLIVDLWGEAGRHARSAPGQGPSPFGVPVIIDAMVAVS
jgi:enamine deaminase RidA (YjgF/YER057c/UK114 family)